MKENVLLCTRFRRKSEKFQDSNIIINVLNYYNYVRN